MANTTLHTVATRKFVTVSMMGSTNLEPILLQIIDTTHTTMLRRSIISPSPTAPPIQTAASAHPDIKYRPRRLIKAAPIALHVSFDFNPGTHVSAIGTKTTYIPTIKPARFASTVDRPLCINADAVKLATPSADPHRILFAFQNSPQRVDFGCNAPALALVNSTLQYLVTIKQRDAMKNRPALNDCGPSL
jgi:hypothetical protein